MQSNAAITAVPQITSHTIPSAGESAQPTGNDSRSILFARDDDLFRSSISGYVEQLTFGGSLRWGMKAGGDEWRIIALSQLPRVSSDGQWIAFSSNGDQIHIIDLQGQPQESHTMPGSQNYAWSPNSSELAYTIRDLIAEGEQLLVYDVDTGSSLPLMTMGIYDVGPLVWSPDGQRIAFGCCYDENGSNAGESQDVLSGQLRVFDLTTKQVETMGPLFRSIAGGVENFCWTEDNEVTTVNDQLGIDNSLFCGEAPDRSISPDGQYQFYVSGPSELEMDADYQLVIEAAGVELWRRELDTGLWPIDWSPDGQYILLDDTQNHSPIWRLPANGTGELEIIVDDGYLLGLVTAWK